MRILFSLSLMIQLLLLCSCKNEVKNENEFTGPIPGEIQILNGCGIPKASERVRNHLMERGFDVIETGNADSWNYDKTLIVLRKPEWAGVQLLKKALRTDQVLLLRNPKALVDVSIYLGKDIEELLAHDRKNQL